MFHPHNRPPISRPWRQPDRPKTAGNPNPGPATKKKKNEACTAKTDTHVDIFIYIYTYPGARKHPQNSPRHCRPPLAFASAQREPTHLIPIHPHHRDTAASFRRHPNGPASPAPFTKTPPGTHSYKHVVDGGGTQSTTILYTRDDRPLPRGAHACNAIPASSPAPPPRDFLPVREHDALHVLRAHPVDVRPPVDHGIARPHEGVHQLLPALSPHDAQPQELLPVALLAQRILRTEKKRGGRGGSGVRRIL